MPLITLIFGIFSLVVLSGEIGGVYYPRIRNVLCVNALSKFSPLRPSSRSEGLTLTSGEIDGTTAFLVTREPGQNRPLIFTFPPLDASTGAEASSHMLNYRRDSPAGGPWRLPTMEEAEILASLTVGNFSPFRQPGTEWPQGEERLGVWAINQLGERAHVVFVVFSRYIDTGKERHHVHKVLTMDHTNERALAALYGAPAQRRIDGALIRGSTSARIPFDSLMEMLGDNPPDLPEYRLAFVYSPR